MTIKHFIAGPIETNCYLLIDDETKCCALVDAPPDASETILPVLAEGNLLLEAILLTHSHWDHSADAAKLRRETGAKVYVHPDDEYRIVEPDLHSIFRLPFKLEPCRSAELLSGEMNLSFGNIGLTVLHTPGHTEGGVCFVWPDAKTVFCGDTIFCESIGRSDLPGGDSEVLLQSIKSKIYSLPDEYELMPGHGPKTNVGYEKKNNPFVRG